MHANHSRPLKRRAAGADGSGMQRIPVDPNKLGRPAFIESFPITVVCAWKVSPACTPTIRDGSSIRVSHGICPACRDHALAQAADRG